MDTQAQEYWLEKMSQAMVFKHMNRIQLLELLKASSIVKYQKNDTVVKEGDTSNQLYAILEGTVHVMVNEKTGKNVFICSIGDGNIFGEAGLFLTVKRTASIICPDSAAILQIERKPLMSFLKNYPVPGLKMLMIVIYSLLKKLRDANQEIAFERKADLEQSDIDTIIGDFM